MTAEQQYLDLGRRLLREGAWVENERTGKRCLTIINADMTYDVGGKEFPMLSTKQCFWKSAVAEKTGYLRAYTSAKDFRELGTKTWDMNANKTQAWLDNPLREGEDHMGVVYGAVGRNFGGIDLLDEIYEKLCKGIDDRGLILTYWKPDEFHKGCLRPCMYSHHFSLLGDTLHLNSLSRSKDVPLGLPFNMLQCYFLLDMMAKITGHKAGSVFHKMVNVHIYEDQIPMFEEQLSRAPLTEAEGFNPKFELPEDLTYEKLLTTFIPSDCSLTGYKHLGKINFPFSE